jgi:hypothetical protein
MGSELEEVLRRHRLEDGDLRDQHLFDGMHALEVVTRSLRGAVHHVVPDRLELEQELLEPQLENLVDHDEEELVVSRWIGFEILQLEELRDL